MKIKLNRQGVRDLLRSDEVEAACKELADGISLRAGAGYEVDSRKGRNRAIAEVRAVTDKAKRDNLNHNTLLKVMK